MEKNVHKSLYFKASVQNARATLFCTVESNKTWVLSMKLPLCHPSGVYNSETVPTFLQNFCTSVFKKSILTPCASHHTSNSVPTGRILTKFDMSIFRKAGMKFQVSLQYDKNGYFT